jgi:hypothetical protein
LQLPCQKKLTPFVALKNCCFHWRNGLFEASNPVFLCFVRFPTKPVAVSQKSPDHQPPRRVCVVFAACQGWFQAGTVIADSGRITASFAPAFSTTTKDSS